MVRTCSDQRVLRGDQREDVNFVAGRPHRSNRKFYPIARILTAAINAVSERPFDVIVTLIVRRTLAITLTSTECKV